MEKLRGVGERKGSGGYTEFAENASIRIGVWAHHLLLNDTINIP